MAENTLSGWNEQTITVSVLPESQEEFGAAEASVVAQSLGDWAYHPLIGDPIWGERGHCDITHIPTGLSIAIRASTPDDARRIVEALQGVEIKTRCNARGRTIGAPETQVAILERIIPIAGDMTLGLYRPGDLLVTDLMKTARRIRREMAKRPLEANKERN